MEGRYNTRSPAVKRLMKEAQELSEPTDQYYAQPLEDNLFEWHFTVRGPADSEFQNGIYHGRIILPVDYPMKPPSIIWLTPNGRFETNKKICLSISGHHPESWQPSWSIRTALLAIIGFMPTHGGGAIGSLDYTADERKILAKKSREWKCQNCGDVQSILLEPSSDAKTTSEEVQKLAAQINFQSEQPKNTSSDVGVKKPPSTSAQSSSSQAGKAQRSSSQLDTPVTQTTSQQSEQISNATSVSWNVPQPGVFNPWCMPPYPNMGGFPFHPSVSSHSVGMLVDDTARAEEKQAEILEENFESLLDEWKKWSQETRTIYVDGYTKRENLLPDLSNLASSSDLSRLCVSASLPNVLVHKPKRLPRPLWSQSDSKVGNSNIVRVVPNGEADDSRFHRIEAVVGDSHAVGRRHWGHRRHHHHNQQTFSNDISVFVLLVFLLGLSSTALAFFIAHFSEVNRQKGRLMFSRTKFFDEL